MKQEPDSVALRRFAKAMQSRKPDMSKPYVMQIPEANLQAVLKDLCIDSLNAPKSLQDAPRTDAGDQVEES